jgi:hypothetical protein
MNSKQLARIALSLLFIYMLILLALQLVMSFIYFLPGLDRWGEFSLVSVLVSFFMLVGVAVAGYLLKKTDTIAEKITTPSTEGADNIDWAYLSHRLIAIIAGFYCLYAVFLKLTACLRIYSSTRRSVPTEMLISTAVLLAVGIYLLCGAPHFVRWQARQTRKICDNITTEKG